ncbi:ywbF [Fragariocoptes setiger]|uniref:YwbF n=1 Tax=Fragariocoptes setiger TaxID=1670756 RepID=A0ABQ7S7C4_9ACAR|nr:ywbF [Fragariocoptes setiger]
MIFKIHYFFFNAGLSAILMLLTVFLRRYSDASSTEVGTLLMILPFLAVFAKPFFCSLADRHQKYKSYFILSLCATVLGFGSFVVLPFFPEFIANEGRLAWYILIVLTIIGYLAYGVAWCLGDSFAANISHKTGESFGMIRLWGTVGWGVSGAIVGSLSEYSTLPVMVPGLFVLWGTFIFEIGLLLLWPRKEDFVMGDKSVLANIDPHSMSNGNKNDSSSTKPTMDLSNYERHQSQAGSLRLSVDRSKQASVIATFTPIDATTINESEQNNKVMMTSMKASSSDLLTDNKEGAKKVSDLQMTIFKMVAMRHKSLIKYMIIFVIHGLLFNIHWSFFFLHLEALAAEGHGGFSTLVGICLVAQAVGETLCFMIAPWVCKKLGRDGSISLNAASFVVRYLCNGYLIPSVSPYVAIFTESLQGINYGVFYYLVTDTALHYALLVEDIIPDLYLKQMINHKSDLNAVRTSLRATMQGLFSGAFDGLGFGLGAIIAGLVLENHRYEDLWIYTGFAALVFMFVHGFYELLNRYIRQRMYRRSTIDSGIVNAVGKS